MSTRKSMKLPILVVLIFLIIVVSFFSSIKQKEVTCKKLKSYSLVQLEEVIVSKIERKRIKSMDITKTISLIGNHNRNDIDKIVKSLNHTLEYLDKKVKYTISEDKIIVKIHVDKNEIVLLDNISFDKGDKIEIKINSNTKSSDLLALKVMDNYTDGEYMKFLKKKGYRCK